MQKHTTTKTTKDLTTTQAQAAARIGRRLAERGGLESLTEGDILEVIWWATEALDLDSSHFHPFKLLAYKAIIEQRPQDAAIMTPKFRQEVMAS